MNEWNPSCVVSRGGPADGALRFDEAMRAYRVILAARKGESVAAANAANEDAMDGMTIAQVVAGCNAKECQVPEWLRIRT